MDPTKHQLHHPGDQVLPAQIQTHPFLNMEVDQSAPPVRIQVARLGLRLDLELHGLTPEAARDLMEEEQGVGEMHLIRRQKQQQSMEV